MSLKGKIIAVTGANSGIGKETARALAEMHAHVILICRNEDKAISAQQDIMALTGNPKVDILLCDFSRHVSIREMSEKFHAQYSHLDVLVNNAGGIVGEKKMTPDGFEWMFGVNHLGYFLTTHYLFPAIEQSKHARIVNVASLAHRFSGFDPDNMNAEKSFGEMKTYGFSKLCNILFTRKLASITQGRNVAVNSLHPGSINSNFGNSGSPFFNGLIRTFGKYLLKTTVQGARTSIHLASSNEVEGITGEHFSDCRVVIPSATARNQGYADLLWERSCALTGIHTFGKF